MIPKFYNLITNKEWIMDIQEIQNRKEDQTFDCKSIQIEPKALAISIVAMANADGGVIAIGVSDKTRRIEGILIYLLWIVRIMKTVFC